MAAWQGLRDGEAARLEFEREEEAAAREDLRMEGGAA
jgi:hypothetical protein